MKKLLSLVAVSGLVCVGLLTGCKKQAETGTMPTMSATNAPAVTAPEAPATNAPAAPVVNAPVASAPAARGRQRTLRHQHPRPKRRLPTRLRNKVAPLELG